jgi:predicted DNA-binding transcriptional regulator AlpA
MPGPGNQQNQQNATLTKRDVIELLGKSKRSIDTYMADGRLPYEYVSSPNGRTAAFQRADVERLKRDLETPIRATPGSVVATDSSRIEPYRADPQAVAGTIAAVLREALHAPAPVRPWLSIDEAVTFSGLTRSWLLSQAESSKPAVTVRDMGKYARGGRWRFCTSSLNGK